ncbi:MAG: M48 family metalloprotease [Croceibacterium sp.]
MDHGGRITTPHQRALATLVQRKLYRFINPANPLPLRAMKRSVKFAIALAILALGRPLAAQAADPISLLHAQDIRLEGLSERLLVANDALCRSHMPVAGFLFHSRDQYRTDPGSAFANGPVAVSAVLAGSPAGGILQPGDGLIAIGAQRTDMLLAQGAAPQRDAVFDALASAPPAAPLPLTVRRAGVDQTLSLRPLSGCRALVEIRAADSRNARSDGRVIQIDYGLAVAASDEQLAAAFAHEFAHLVLEHRRRLTAAGVAKGFFGEFGKNQRLNRQVEVEADRLSVHLLANAGFDPGIAPAFWRSPLGRKLGGLSAVYPSPEARAQLLEREIAEYLGAGPAPSWPGHLLSRRDLPF